MVRSLHSPKRPMRFLQKLVVGCALISPVCADSIARTWNEQCLAAIRLDFPAPTVHARNLFHLSAAMYDAWAAYTATSRGVFWDGAADGGSDVEAARREAISYAAYRILTDRYSIAVGSDVSTAALDAQMTDLGYDISITTTVGDSPAAVGNRIAATILANAATDGSDQENLYVGDTNYATVNPNLVIEAYEVDPKASVDPNRWQPLEFQEAFTQNGQETSPVQNFIGTHWGNVRPFALRGTLSGTDADGYVYDSIDPGAPPQLTETSSTRTEFLDGLVQLLEYSATLTPTPGIMIDVSPGSLGNNTLGQNDGNGHSVNPITGLPYESYQVNQGDYTRAIAEFWADGPDSETPPGHWNVLANDVMDSPNFSRQFMGQGPELSPLEYDVKFYLTLNAAMHDAAIATWGVKRFYDYSRPISQIRFAGVVGQSSDPNLPLYDPLGLPLIDNLIEISTDQTTAFGGKHEGNPSNLIVVRSWSNRFAGGDFFNPTVEPIADVEWIPAGTWVPFQRDTFVSPAFAGYVSGHSAFSRAGAEVLTALTGSAFFPGGLGVEVIEENTFKAEEGPTETIELQWATYYDAADQAGISRIYGGIHIPADDGPGRIIGAQVGQDAVAKSLTYFTGSAPVQMAFDVMKVDAGVALEWTVEPGYVYTVEVSSDLGPGSFSELVPTQSYTPPTASFVDTTAAAGTRFYRINRLRAPSP